MKIYFGLGSDWVETPHAKSQSGRVSIINPINPLMTPLKPDQFAALCVYDTVFHYSTSKFKLDTPSYLKYKKFRSLRAQNVKVTHSKPQPK